MTKIRTRFAPSPTGFLHVGGVRTALFAWLLARQSGGKFILRLEDTDQKREVEGSAAHLIECLNTLGIEYDEGPGKEGEYGPYIQSQRLDIYRKWAQKLIDSGRAYADPYTQDEINQFREQAKAEKRAFLYRNHRPENTKDWDGTTPLRFKSDPKPYQWHDEVMGDLSTGPEVVDDIILMKSDGYPTYNFAHIVDDAEMGITHVIRGQEFIASHPNYLNLYEALELERPVFATMPHILAETGGKKLGKRDGAKDVLDYIKDGYVSEALLNFIASLGWNDGTEQEIFTKQELIEKFRLDRVQKSGARFDARRLLWMNGQHIRSIDSTDLYDRVTPNPESSNLIDTLNFWPESATKIPQDEQMTVLQLVQDRLKTLADLPILSSYFFEEPAPNWSMANESKPLKKLSTEERAEILQAAVKALTNSPFDKDSLQDTLNTLLDTTGQKPAVLFSLIRLSISWAPFSPALNESLEVLGKETSIKRLNLAISTLE